MQTNTSRQEDASFGQERIWNMCQTYAHIPLYNIGFSMYLEGRFDQQISEDALNIIISRHESLRTTFSFVNNQLKQIIVPELKVKGPIINREGFPLEKIPSEIRRIAKAETLKHFDLEYGPLVRSYFVKFGEEHFGWIVVMHHTIGDGWSVGLLAYEMNMIYRALATGHKTKFPTVPMQYADYVKEERKLISHDQFIKSLHYWEKRLQGIEKAAPQDTDVNFERYHYTFTAESIKQLHLLSKQYATTLFMICLLAFRITLFKNDGVNDRVITVPTAIRNHFKLQKTMGYLVNLLPIRMILSSDSDLATFIKKAIGEMRDDFSHPNVPIEYLSKHLQWSDNENPLLQTLFALQNYPVPENIYNYKIMDLCDYFDLTEFNLSMRISTYKKECDMEVIYNVNLYQREWIEKLAKDYCEVLTTMSHLRL